MVDWRWIHQMRLRLRSVFDRSRVERELDEEFRFHVEQRIQLEISQRMPLDEARSIALRAMDGIEQQKEACRDMRRTRFIDEFLQDLRYTIRSMRKRPALSLVIFTSLALGIGANTAIFGLIDAVLLRPLPGVARAEALVSVSNGSHSFSKFERLRERGLLDQTVAVSDDRLRAEIGGSLQMINVNLASGEYFQALGAPPLIGRTIRPDDERTGAAVAVLDHDFWEKAFSRDPAVVGKSIRISGEGVTIIGVTRPEFKGTRAGDTLPEANARLRVEWPRILEAAAANSRRFLICA